MDALPVVTVVVLVITSTVAPVAGAAGTGASPATLDDAATVPDDGRTPDPVVARNATETRNATESGNATESENVTESGNATDASGESDDAGGEDATESGNATDASGESDDAGGEDATDARNASENANATDARNASGTANRTDRSAGGVEASEPVEVVVTFESHDARRRALADDAGTAAGGVVPQGVTATTVADGEGVELVPMVTLRLPAGAVEAVAAAPGVESVAADATVEPTAQTVPWGTSRVSGPAAAAAVGAANQSTVDVAVVDSGVDGDHPDLAVAWGTNTVGSATGGPSDDDWNDTGGHGTASAGVVAARDNDVGTLGVAPAVDLYAVKVYESSGTVTDLVEGIDAAVAGPDGDVGTDDDAEVLSLSLGTTDSPALERAVEEATAAGAVVVAAAGNDGDGDGATNEVVHPAKYPEVVAVSATDQDDEPARFGNGNFSSEGGEVDLAAPGALVETTRLGGGTRRYSGTSAATPHVAGAAALVVADGRNATPADVTRRLRATADDVDAPAEDPRTGTGRLNASRAVSNPFGRSVVDGTYAPRDPDRDGLYEDVDGDGVADLDDVFALAFDVVPDAGGFDAEERAALDFEPDGTVDLDDVFALAFGEP